MRLAVAAGTLVLVAGCGGSSGTQQLSAAAPSPATPVATQPSTSPTTTAAAPVPVRTTGPASPVAVPPATAQAIPGAGYAGTASAGTASVGPGRVSSPAPSPPPRPTPSPVAGTVTVTDADSGSTVHLAVGQHLRVRLGQGTWDPPTSSADRVVVRRSSAGGYPSDQPVDATFDAVATGSADVTAQSDAACFHTQPRCMMAQRQWQVRVVVG